MKITWTKDDMKDSRGYPMTQALFLETVYSPYAIWTFDDEDKEYTYPDNSSSGDKAGKTVVMKSLRSYYLDIADPTEYQFAKTCTLGWDHWQRIIDNKMIRKEVDKWREELEVALRSEGIQSIISSSASESGNYQAAKWLAEKGWIKNDVGRPKKVDRDREERINNRIKQTVNSTVTRMEDYIKNV